MDWKLIISLACASTLALGACSGSNPSVSAGGETDPDGGETDPDGGEEPVMTPLQEAKELFDQAEEAVKEARAAITAGNLERAERLVTDALSKLRNAAEEAQKAVDAAAVGSAARNLALAQQVRTNTLRNSQTTLLNNALAALRASSAWYSKKLIRHTFANGVAVTPKDGTNKAKIRRIEQTRDTSATDTTQIPNLNNEDSEDDAFTASTFKTVPYADDKRAFVPSDDEFKVDGYTAELASYRELQPNHWTGLKLTSGGLVIRTGGPTLAPCDHGVGQTCNAPDFTDMRRDITRFAGDTNDDGEVDASDGLRGQNGWDLEITFNEPQPVSVRGGDSSWNGNADFYWRAIVEADEKKQLATDGEYYQADAFKQPDNLKDLGTYEVWLSNHLGVVDRGFEPVQGSGVVSCPDGQGGFTRGTSCPFDDTHHYLKYAAYGLFIYTADTETYWALPGGSTSFPRRNGQNGRMQSIHYGYSAFADESGKKTMDIGSAINSGSFRGQTLAYAVRGYSGNGKVPETRLLRGDATLTVTILKTGTGNISGTLNNFGEWRDGAWKRCGGQSGCLRNGNNFTVTLASTSISNAGEFAGSTTAAGRTDLNGEGGSYRGAVYGPRSDSDDLEVAGSWTIGFNISSGNIVARDAQWSIMGSFGAKQR